MSEIKMIEAINEAARCTLFLQHGYKIKMEMLASYAQLLFGAFERTFKQC
tara:strand:+ start:353 stop:502 length:150 start_codon:yes stop_codon:yes gene_type:complete